MLGLKGKIYLILILTAFFLGGLGYLSISKLLDLTGRIGQLSDPNEKWELFQSLTIDLSRLNNLFISQTFDYDEARKYRHLELIDTIKQNIVELSQIYELRGDPSIHELDTIPKILDQMVSEFDEITKLKSKKQYEAFEVLEAELMNKLSDINAKDSILIIERLSYEVRVRNLPDTIFIERAADTSDAAAPRRGLFSRLFGKKESGETPIEQGSNQSLIQDAKIKGSSDSIVNLQFKADTLNVSSVDAITEDDISLLIRQAFNNYSQGKTEISQKIREAEQLFYSRSAKIANNLERLINDLRFKETAFAQQEVQKTYDISVRFSNTMIIIIVLFVFIILMLVSFVLRDLNRNEAYQRKLQLSEEKAKREAIAKSDFLATMSHELRTPLTSIIGYADLLPDDDQNASAIRTSSKYLLQVSNEILDMAKIEAGIIEIKEEPFDLNDLLSDMQQSFQELIANAGMKGVFEFDEFSVPYLGDAFRIRQVLYNLLHNALKFTEKGKIGLHAKHLSQDANTDLIMLKVSDTGVGIASDELESIFDRYQQAGTHKNKMKGTGLGLGIVKKAVELMEGKIEVESELNKGTAFILKLPLKKTDDNSQVQEQTKIKESELALLRGKSIYCLDDDTLIARLYEGILSKYGISVHIETNSLEALQHLIDYGHQYDLVITDLKMPNLSGYDLVRKLNENNCRPALIIAATANVLLFERNDGNLGLFDDYIGKPINKELLIEKLVHCFSDANTDTQALPRSIKKESSAHDASLYSKQDKIEDYDLTDFKAYTLGDEDMLREILQDMVLENQDLINQAFQFMSQNDQGQLADIIHKLSGRFAQLRVSDKIDSKRIELDIRAGNELKEEVLKLLHKWKDVNDVIAEKEHLVMAPNK